MKLLHLTVLAPLLTMAPASYAEQPKTPSCLRIWGEARVRAIGYDHVVVIESSCDRPATCSVATDVAPEPGQVTVEARKTVELTTFRGSPARVFKPTVSCKLQ